MSSGRSRRFAPCRGRPSQRGITAPFAIQKLVIEDVLDGDDVLVQSPTGSGKTLAFGIPLVDLIEADDRHPAALILAPTRELALQIVDELSEIAAARSLSIAPVYGVGLEQQARRAAWRRSSSPPRPARGLPSAARSASSTSACWSSTRPTGCSTWASSPPSTGSSLGPWAIARRCSSRRRSRPRPASSLAPTPTTPYATSTSVRRTAARSSTASSTSSTPTRSGAGRRAARCRSRPHTGLRAHQARCGDCPWRRLGQHGVEAVAMHGNKSQGQRQRALASFASGRVETLVATDVAASKVESTSRRSPR